ncbi:hypothetical protein [Methanocella conradii]|uniref:hypothetical protein n=1 Tax=Methanocella conradii TaxID=1175444 RepID=UPI0024B394C9|nr:hypothetical protein [Methanocella conradii]MDI6896369.1 hypothetical protein [Methanocella conradii]
MGFETIIAAAISVIILMTVSFSLLMGIYASMDSMSMAMKTAMDNKNDQFKTRLSVDYDHVEIYNKNITFVLTNTGDTKIVDIKKMDIVITIYNNSVNNTYWIPYAKDINSTSLGWKDEAIKPDVINPGVLDPAENMTCRVVVPDPPVTGTLGRLALATPNGAMTSGYFRVINNV